IERQHQLDHVRLLPLEAEPLEKRDPLPVVLARRHPDPPGCGAAEFAPGTDRLAQPLHPPLEQLLLQRSVSGVSRARSDDFSRSWARSDDFSRSELRTID